MVVTIRNIALVALVVSPSAARAQDWRLVDTSIPSGVAGVFDSVRNRIVAVGGGGETREWDGARWLHRPVPLLPEWVFLGAFDSVRGRTIALSGSVLINGPVQAWEFDGAAWVHRVTPVAPPELIGGALAFDAARGRAVLFGGGFTPTNATWEWNGVTWQQRFPALSPPVRSAAAMTYDVARGRIVLFGGHVISGFQTIPFDDTWEWDGINWQRRFPPTSPSARTGHRLAFDSARQVTVMFGESPPTSAETWEYDGVTWAQRTGPMPPARAFPGLAYDSNRGRTVMWSGAFGGTQDDVWEWDGVTWQQRLQTSAPTSRVVPASAHSLSRDRLVLFGGFVGTNAAETWEWDGSNWTLLAPPASPPGRYQHSMWSDGVFVYAFGGGLPGAPYGNDTWRFDGATWAPMASAMTPPARHSAAVAFDPTNGGAVLFGGARPAVVLSHYGDTWQWSQSGWNPITTPVAPSPRSSAAIAADPLRQRVVLWGGQGSNGVTDDTWEWDGANWLQQNPVHRPPLGNARSMVFEPTFGAIVLLTTTAPLNRSVQAWLWTGSDWLRLVTPSQPVAAAAISATAAPGRIRLFDSERLFELTMRPALVSSYGASCPSPGPRLFVDAWPRPGAFDFGLASTGHATNAPVFVVVGTAAANGSIGGCPVLVQLGGPLVALTADASGNCALPVPLAPLPALVGFRAFAQAWSLGAVGAASTNGVDVTIGQ